MANYLVIGASTGTGAKTAELLTLNGHAVWGTYLKNEPAEENSGIQYTRLNALDPVFPDAFLPDQLDGFVYCPGSVVLKPFHRLSADDFAEDYNLNVLGFVRCLQLALPLLKKAEMASVVAFSTVAVQQGFPFHSMVAASKGALEGTGRALAAELAPRIRVNIIAPSLTETALSAQFISTPEKHAAQASRNPLKRIGSTHDLAQLAVFLLGSQSSWITGQVIHADGGMGVLKV